MPMISNVSRSGVIVRRNAPQSKPMPWASSSVVCANGRACTVRFSPPSSMAITSSISAR